MKEFRHKKSLGQHFLKDQNIIRKIGEVANISPNELVWEIGPGKGVLTQELLNYTKRLRCFEIDHTLYPILENRFGSKIDLIKTDILKADWNEYFADEPIKIVANLPYQITSPFLFRVAKNTQHFSSVIVMVQKEVAQRIAAKVGTKDYGILTLKMQYYFNPKYEFTVKPNVFNPPPRVDSAVISLVPRLDRPYIEDEEYFWRVVEIALRNRRKMLRRNLRELIGKEQVEKLTESCEIDLQRRGETLTEAEFVSLYEQVYKIKL
ncbi:MAG: ribosomal RNA small subunit methyltransferase A [Candidatus Cloacimonetes bacterium]|nr:ribosomal RNA small subunit methyltransferase A [Candidatus Cloacimonadota bacterium]